MKSTFASGGTQTPRMGLVLLTVAVLLMLGGAALLVAAVGSARAAPTTTQRNGNQRTGDMTRPRTTSQLHCAKTLPGWQQEAGGKANFFG